MSSVFDKDNTNIINWLQLVFYMAKENYVQTNEVKDDAFKT